MRHLARYAATRARLLRVLDRRIDRWLSAARAAAPDDDALPGQAAASRLAARRVVAALAQSGIVDDAAFAASRVRLLGRTGSSRARIARHLAERGIDATTAQAALPADPERELAAALWLARKRRLGGFAPPTDDPAARRRALGILARAGFSHDIATRALATPPEQAETRIAQLRRG